MAKIKGKWGKLEAIMIDGYAPNISHYRAMDIDYLVEVGQLPKEEFYIRTFPRNLRSPSFSEKYLVQVFSRFVEGFRKNFCLSHKKETMKITDDDWRGKRYDKLCGYLYFTTKGRSCNIENLKNSRKYKKYLPSVTPEYRNDEQRGKERYVQNVIMYSTEALCPKLQECRREWLHELNFKIKSKKEYKDFQLFKAGWQNILRKLLRESRDDLVDFPFWEDDTIR